MNESNDLLPRLFVALQEEMRSKLATAEVLEHPDAKGDQSELNWEKLLTDHLPQRYRVLAKAKVIDFHGHTSQEIDLLVIDRQYSPFVFHSDARTYVPAESVYAAFECKQGLDRANVDYAAAKVASVRRLHRTSAPINHAGGVYAPREPGPIIGGLLTSRVDWASGLGEAFTRALTEQSADGRLDVGCALAKAGWSVNYDEGGLALDISQLEQAVMYFMLTVQARLQGLGTVTAMDFDLWKQALRQLPPRGD